MHDPQALRDALVAAAERRRYHQGVSYGFSGVEPLPGGSAPQLSDAERARRRRRRKAQRNARKVARR